MADGMSRVEVLPSGIVIVYCEVNYGLTPLEAIKELPRSNTSISPVYDLAYWNDGKSGIVKASIPLFIPRHDFSTAAGRRGIAGQNFGYAIPADLVPLGDYEIRCTLIDIDIRYVVALGKSDDSLPQGRVVYLDLRRPGFCLSGTHHDWDSSVAVAGSPQVSR